MIRALAKIVLGILVLFLVLEVTARLSQFGIGGLDPRRNGMIRGGGIKERLDFDTDPAIVFEYKPNLDKAFLLNHFRSNSWGMRDREYPLEKPADTFRVAVIGSSFSLPAGVEIEDAYHSVLEERLSEELAPTRYEFLNFAVGLHLPSQFVAMIQLRALRFDPDLILVSASSPAVNYFHQKWNRVSTPAVLDQISGGIRSTLVTIVRSRLGIHRATNPEPMRLWGKPEGRSVTQKLGDITRETGVPIVVVRLEMEAREPMPVEKRLERGVWANGMYYLDTRHAFAGENPRDYWVWELDPHPNAGAHAIFADVIEAFLRTEGLLDGSYRR